MNGVYLRFDLITVSRSHALRLKAKCTVCRINVFTSAKVSY